MVKSVKWRLIIIGLVLAFALFNLYPTLKWASLSENRKAELTARWDKQRENFEENRTWHALKPEDRLAQIRTILQPLKEAHEDNKLDQKFWKRVDNPDLSDLSDDEKKEFLSLCSKLIRKDIPPDVTLDGLRKSLVPLRNVRKKLNSDFWEWVRNPQWETLKRKEKESYREIVAQLTGERIPRTLSIIRNMKNWLVRWWQGDEDLTISLGLDLKGGSYFVVEVEKPKGVSLSDAVEGSIQILSQRIDRLGVREPIIQRQGLSTLVVQLPGVTDVNRARGHIEEPAFMRWMLVDEDRMKLPQFSEERLLRMYDRALVELKEEFQDKKDSRGNPAQWTMSDLDRKLAESVPPDTILRVYEYEERRGGERKPMRRTPLLLQSSLEEPEVLTGGEVTRAQYSRDPETGEPVVVFSLNSKGTGEFAELTREYNSRSRNRIRTPDGYRGWRLAILVDEKVISAPNIRTEILGGSGQIEGDFTPNDAKDLANRVQTGALPAKLNIVAENSIGPTLGTDSVRRGVLAAIVGLLCVIFFMAVYYLFAGVLANLALLLNLIIILGMLASLGATLTLPGIAGIILTIGMSVDANVLIFERIREELAAAKKIAAAIDSGYQKAFRTILDSNVTTFISAVVLYYLGTGPVRGFAVTLIIGLATSMFTAIVVTRVIFDLMLRSKRFQTLHMLALLRKPTLDFVRQMGKAVMVSAVVIFAGIVSFAAKWSDNFGIDFTGGYSATIVFQDEVSRQHLARIRKVLSSSSDIEDFSLRRFRLQGEPTHRGVILDAKLTQTASSPALDKRVGEALRGENPVDTAVQPTVAEVYPVVARRLWKQAILAVTVSLVAMLIYISWRFEFRFALGGILALFHDVLVTVGFMTGFFILTRRQLNLPVVAAMLTIIGYSINDTIVIFDRVREDMKLMKGISLRTIINTAVNQTLSRTILTSGTTLMAVAALLFFGGQAINDFAFAMFVGCIAGVYSTVYIASPIALLLEKTR